MEPEQILILESKLELKIGTFNIVLFVSGGAALTSPHTHTPFEKKYLNNETRENSKYRQQIRANIELNFGIFHISIFEFYLPPFFPLFFLILITLKLNQSKF